MNYQSFARGQNRDIAALTKELPQLLGKLSRSKGEQDWLTVARAAQDGVLPSQ